MAGDAELIRLAREGIEGLNRKYENHRPDIFFLCHRPRRWNAQEGVWMGYERKRGKLMEFNAFLRGKKDGFAEIVGDITNLPEVRYVITLDTDTQLPRDSAHQMVGTMAHILNRPIFDPVRRRVVTGYGILQPRVGVSLPTARRSWFVRLFAGDPGLDPYTRAVSDVYQDLFGEGSFVGKGIYDVDAFEKSCGGLPDNTILSHDLLESAYVRSALLSDVELFEEFPSLYAADVSRRHRWMRGDWQIASWLLPRVPASEPAGQKTAAVKGGTWVKNPISALSWWKIFDNLRRSLVPVAMVVVLIGSWMLGDAALARHTTLFVLVMVAALPLLAAVEELLRKPADLPVVTHLRVVARGLAKHASQILFTLVFLPYDAFSSVDAIVRTLTRMLWTKKKMLEWKTSSAAARGAPTDLAGFARSMWIGPALALLVFLAALLRTELLIIAGPLLILWLASPLTAWWLSRVLEEAPDRLTDDQREFLGLMSRRTWRFFEVFVTEEENWLPPDNFQEHPTRAVASRTSPTNIGMALLANLAAYDFGYSSAAQLLDRTSKTFATLGRMDKYRGHFYNWYDTRSLKPLAPLYVSTVDSGNMVGHLLVLRIGLMDLAQTSVLPPKLFPGLRTTIRVLLEAARGGHQHDKDKRLPLVSADILRRIESLDRDLADRTHSLSSAVALLDKLVTGAAVIAGDAGTDDETKWWASTLHRACTDHRDDLVRLAAWIRLAPPAEQLWTQGAPEQLKRLGELRTWWARLDTGPTLAEVAALEGSLLPLVDAILKELTPQSKTETAASWLPQLRRALADSSRVAVARLKSIEDLARQCHEFADIDYSFLFNKAHDLFAIGYNASDHRLDGSFYDLLASEARLTSFIAVAQGQVGQEHWFALSRMVTTTGGTATLLSWSGSMFEYLMPLLVMPTYPNTLLDQSYHSAVRRQIKYGRQRGVPWGISESGFNTVDLHLIYQYRAFGVPGLGLKRGLAEDLVIAPYATVLALMVAPKRLAATWNGWPPKARPARTVSMKRSITRPPVCRAA